MGLFIPRAREPAALDESERSRDKQFTRIVTDLYNVVSSAFRGFASASSRSSSDFGRLATGVTTRDDFFQSQISKHHCDVPRIKRATRLYPSRDPI